MSSLLYRELCNIPTIFIIGSMAIRVFKIEKKILFFIVFSFVFITETAIPTEFALKPVIGLLLFIACFSVFGKTKLLKTIFGSIFVFITILVSEIFSGFLTVAIYGKPVSENFIETNTSSMFAIQIMFWLMLSISCYILERIWISKTKTENESDYSPFLLFPLCQIAVLGFSAVLACLEQSGFYINLALTLEVFCFLFLNIALAYMIDESYKKRKAEEHAKALMKEIEIETSYYNRKVERIKKISKIRHDIRNQLETARILKDRGEYNKVEKQLDEMLVFLEGINSE